MKDNALEREITYPLHPITAEYADFTEAEAEKMRESLRAVGLLYGILLWKGRVVDGRHRLKLCTELGIAVRM
jgi:ParB-like chromosome segregation protein Spo0J